MIAAAVAVCSIQLFDFEFRVPTTPEAKVAMMRETVWASERTGGALGDYAACATFCVYRFKVEGRDWCLTLDADRPRLRRLR